MRSTWTEAHTPNGVVLADFDGNGVDDPATAHLHGYSIRLDQGFGVEPMITHTAGFDTIFVTTLVGDDNAYAVGHLLLDGYAPTAALLRERTRGR